MMPTINQLVRKNRQAIEKKSTAPALQKGFNSLHKKATDASAPQKRGVCVPRSLLSDLPEEQHEGSTGAQRTSVRLYAHEL